MKTASPRKEVTPSFQMFLRIKHPSMNPQDITAALGMEPEHEVHAGPAASRSGVQRLHSESYWIASLPTPSSEELAKRMPPPASVPALTKKDAPGLLNSTEYDLFILAWLRRLEDAQPFFQKINKETGSVTLLIQRDEASGPISIRCTLVRLAQYGIGLEID